MNNKYIICADDFGLTKSVNKAVIDVFNKNDKRTYNMLQPKCNYFKRSIL